MIILKRILLVFVLTTCTILLQSQAAWTNVKERGADPTAGSQQQPSKWQETFKKENEELLAKNAYIRSKNNFLRPPMVTTTA